MYLTVLLQTAELFVGHTKINGALDRCCSTHPHPCLHTHPPIRLTPPPLPPLYPATPAPRSWHQRLRANRSAAAALKLWLGMSGLVVLFVLVAENPQGSIHPTVAYAVQTVPTHGVIALVLAWHERVESTFIRVGGLGKRGGQDCLRARGGGD